MKRIRTDFPERSHPSSFRPMTTLETSLAGREIRSDPFHPFDRSIEAFDLVVDFGVDVAVAIDRGCLEPMHQET